MTLENEDTTLIRDVVRQFVEKEMPREAARRWDREDHFPREVFEKLAALGMMMLAVPEEYGGAGRHIVSAMAVIEELSKRSQAVATPYLMCVCYGGMNIAEHGTPAQKERLLPAIAGGKLLFAYGLTEPDVGADLASVRTTARRAGDKVVVRGAKSFCSGANIADYIYCLVRSGPEDQRHRNLSFILVPTNAPGVTITITDAIGLKGAPTTDVTFDDVELPLDSIVGGEAQWNNGWKQLAGSALNIEKLEVCAIALGAAEAAVSDAWEYAQQRRQFGKAICGHQAIRHSLANLKTDLYACRLMLYHTAAQAERGADVTVQSSMAKLFVTERCKSAVLEAITVMGAYGLTREFDMERYLRDALVMPVGGGSSNIQRNNIANLLRLPKE